MAELPRMSPLGSMAAAFSRVEEQSGGAISICEILFATQLTLRAELGSAAACAVERVIGGPLPLTPNTVAFNDGVDALWLGPDEWLLVSLQRSAGELEDALRSGWGAAVAAVTDTSAQRTIIELGGGSSRTVLARGCALDLHESVFGVGDCRQTLIAQAPVILQPIAERDAIRVFVRPSFALYLGAWLLDATVEERKAEDRVEEREMISSAR